MNLRTKILLSTFIIIFNNHTILPMEKDTKYSLVHSGAAFAKNESNLIQNVLNEFCTIHDKALLETTMPNEAKTYIKIFYESNKELMTLLQEDSTNLILYQAMPNIFKGATFFVSSIEQSCIQEPTLLNYLKDYYAALGKVTVIHARIRKINKKMQFSS